MFKNTPTIRRIAAAGVVAGLTFTLVGCNTSSIDEAPAKEEIVEEVVVKEEKDLKPSPEKK